MRTESGGSRRNHLRALAQRVEVDTRDVRIMQIEKRTPAHARRRIERKIGNSSRGRTGECVLFFENDSDVRSYVVDTLGGLGTTCSRRGAVTTPWASCAHTSASPFF
jgi:hypothetical protein